MFYSKEFRKIFFIRFLSYFFMLLGVTIIIMIIEPVFAEEIKYRFNKAIGREHRLPRIVTSAGETITAYQNNSNSGLGSISFGTTEVITPVSTDFGIVIEKINANAKIVPNVNPSNERVYMQALQEGVAHAAGTAFPGQKGNIYLFSHSTNAPWNVVRFNAIFYLLNKLERGDKIVLFYEGRRYDYVVFDKVVVPPSETKYLTDRYEDSILTLQTCDPPGTTINRLIVRAKLASEQ